MAHWLQAADDRQIVWTRGTTKAINLVAHSWLVPCLQPDDEIVVSEAEHHANLVPWLMVAQASGAKVIKWPIGADRRPYIALLPQLLNVRTRLLAMGQMSDVTGGYPDLAQSITLAHGVGAKVMVDGAQGVVHCPPNVQALDIDFYVFSAHKLYGPMGIGVLYGKADLLEAIQPWQGGGKMLTQVDFSGFTPQPVPWRFEAGTPNVAGVVGLSAALDWLAQHDAEKAERWSQQRADGTLHFYGDSEGRIVRRLLAVLLTAVEGKTPAALLAADLLTLFDNLGLRTQLSAPRAAVVYRRWPGRYSAPHARIRQTGAPHVLGIFQRVDTATKPKVAVT